MAESQAKIEEIFPKMIKKDTIHRVKIVILKDCPFLISKPNIPLTKSTS